MSPNSLQISAPLLRKPLKAIVQEVAKAKDMSEIEAQGRDLLVNYSDFTMTDDRKPEMMRFVFRKPFHLFIFSGWYKLYIIAISQIQSTAKVVPKF